MGTYQWSIPSGKQITGQTFIKDTDNNIADTISDLVDFVNGEGNHTGQGLTYDLVDKATEQTITAHKVFNSGITADVIGNVTGDVTGNSGTSTKLASAKTISLSGQVTGSVLFDGSANVNMITTVNTNPFITGMIMLWSGSPATIPSGWYLCDGNNNTPNLKDRFVVGAGSSYSVGNTGGSKDAVVVAHGHSITGSTSTNGFHTHPRYNGYYQNSDLYDRSTAYGNDGNFSADTSSYGAGDHSHTISGTALTTGESGVNKNLPPYYALCYIMKG